jgi:lipopolysaccharide/colanic/teichoic acid biosynthesis glycosyltransferase
MSCARRALDIFFAVSVFLVFGAPMLIIALCVRVTLKGNALFSQDRVGQGGHLFRIYKFRTMTDLHQEKAGLTQDGDRRVTPFGRFLRKFKLDELPQFYNVLRGDMSLVGPRPKVPQYAGLLNMPYRPGISGVATIAFRREGEILRSLDANQIDLFYAQRIRPVKARLDACYMCRATPFSDIGVLGSTVLGCVMPSRVPTVTYAALTAVCTQQNQAPEL